MDLLEYMRSQNNMTQAEWERRFEDAARELLVLLAGSGGARECNGFGDSAHSNLAYVDCETGVLRLVRAARTPVAGDLTAHHRGAAPNRAGDMHLG